MIFKIYLIIKQTQKVRTSFTTTVKAMGMITVRHRAVYSLMGMVIELASEQQF